MHDPYLKRSQPDGVQFVRSACEQPAIDGQSVASVTNKKVVKFEPSPLRLPILPSGSSSALPFTYLLGTRGHSISVKHAFKIYSIWPQANKYVTNTLPQCSSASVGLTQAHPNNTQKRKSSTNGQGLGIPIT